MRIAALLGLLLLAPAIGAAQQAEADSAWSEGDYHLARIRYEAVLRSDPANVRANYRLGILASWAGRLDSALVLVRRARSAEPGDPDIRSTEARILGWAGRSDAALALYDSVIADYPNHPDALAGKGQVYYWQGRYSVARSYLSRALAADPDHRTAVEVNQLVLAASRPQPELALGWSNDSDDNTSWWQVLGASYPLQDGLRLTGQVSALEASDPVRNAFRLGIEGGAIYALGNLYLNGGMGARWLNPDAGPGRTEPTLRLAGGYRLGSAGVGAGYSHYPFDETARLIGQDLDIDAVELNGDATVRPGLVVGAGASFASLSDGNSRTAGILTLTQTIRRDFFAGVMARALGYDFRGTGYFSPDRFTVYEVRGGYARTTATWTRRLSGGLGIQQVRSDGKVQSEWHLEGRLGRRWSTANLVEVFAGLSSSAESSTTGAFRYRTAGVVVRISF